jgi:hypothetical protein
MLPAITIISNCWACYNTFKDEGYRHPTVSHISTFIDKTREAHAPGKHVEALLHTHGRNMRYIYCFAECKVHQEAKKTSVCNISGYYQKHRLEPTS